jgi:MSHA pilin protein MshD
MFNRRQRGLSLIEVVVFIVVLGIGFSGMLVLYNQVTRASVDPMVRKQALAIASSLLEEVELRAFTFCDPDDPKVYTAAAATAAECTGAAYVEIIGAETLPSSTIETRYTDPRFDNVSDYNLFQMLPGAIRTISNPTPIAGLEAYSVLVAVTDIAAGELGAGVPVGEALRITVTATHPPTGIAVRLLGYRLRYAPNSP